MGQSLPKTTSMNSHGSMQPAERTGKVMIAPDEVLQNVETPEGDSHTRAEGRGKESLFSPPDLVGDRGKESLLVQSDLAGGRDRESLSVPPDHVGGKGRESLPVQPDFVTTVAQQAAD